MYSLEKFYRVYDDKTGFYWEVRPDADGLNLVEITYYEEDRVFKGITIPPAAARLVAEAIVMTAADLGEKT